MEQLFHEDPIKSEIDRLVEARLHTDDAKNEENRRRNVALQKRLTADAEGRSILATPAYVILDPATEEILEITSGGQSAESFAAFLRRGREAFEARGR